MAIVHTKKIKIKIEKNALYLSVNIFSMKALTGILLLSLLLETALPFYVVIRATQRSGHLQSKGITFTSQAF